VPNFTEAHAAYETVKSFFHVHSNSEHDEENILNLEWLLFHIKNMASNKHSQITDFFGRKHYGQVLTYYFCMKCSIYDFHSLFCVSDTF